MPDKMKEEWDIKTCFGTTVSEFEHYIGRMPKNNEEMEEWVHYLEKGVDAQLDWDIINKCAAENFK